MGKKFRLSKNKNIILEFPEKYMPKDTAAPITDQEIQVQELKLTSGAKPQPKKKKKSGSKKSSSGTYDTIFNIVIRSITLAVMLFALGKIGDTWYANLVDVEEITSIRNEHSIDFTQTNVTPGRDVPPYPMPTPERVTYPEGPTVEALQQLKQHNSDFVFWFYLDGTDISYYVLQAEDNDFYLRRNIDKEYSISGSLFLDYRNNPNSLDGNCIIYGHNMNNGSMFGKLKNFSDPKYFFEHQMIYTYAEDKVTVWKVFSAYNTTTDDYYIDTDFPTDEDYLKFLLYQQDKSEVKTDMILTSKDDILTLSTCHKYTESDGRYVVQAVKVGTAIIN